MKRCFISVYIDPLKTSSLVSSSEAPHLDRVPKMSAKIYQVTPTPQKCYFAPSPKWKVDIFSQGFRFANWCFTATPLQNEKLLLLNWTWTLSTLPPENEKMNWSFSVRT